MKIWIVVYLLFFCSALAAPLQEHFLDSESLSCLATELGIDPKADLIAETQKRWLRSSGQERWELSEIASEKKKLVLEWAEKEGLFSPWKPQEKSFDKALILGATTCRMEKRLRFLVELWQEGYRFDEIVWLTGDRPLDPRIDRLTDRCANESQAARILWEEADLPEALRRLPVLFVAVPMKKEEGVWKRPNTADTIVAWLEYAPGPCKALFFSDQPFCGYQFAVIHSLLPDAVCFDVAGAGETPSAHPAAAAIILDSIARWAYQENLHPTALR